MKSLLNGLPIWVAAFWWGSLSTVGFYVVPMLFANLPTPAMAGAMAGQLFATQTWVALVCGLFLLMSLRSNGLVAQENKGQEALVFIVGGMLLALLSHYAVAPRIMARDNLGLWHSVGTVLYAVQWLCAGLTFKKMRG